MDLSFSYAIITQTIRTKRNATKPKYIVSKKLQGTLRSLLILGMLLNKFLFAKKHLVEGLIIGTSGGVKG